MGQFRINDIYFGNIKLTAAGEIKLGYLYLIARGNLDLTIRLFFGLLLLFHVKGDSEVQRSNYTTT